MEQHDFSLLRLQYEILNASVSSIARQANINVHILESLIADEGWKRKWPDDNEPEIELNESEDELTVMSEMFVEQAKKRLAAYMVAKSIILAQKYLELEVSIINNAIESANTIPPENTKSLKDVATLYSNMMKGTPASTIFGNQVFDNDSGIPTLVIRDLAGGKTSTDD